MTDRASAAAATHPHTIAPSPVAGVKTLPEYRTFVRTVELFGIVYIFNPVDEAILGGSQPDDLAADLSSTSVTLKSATAPTVRSWDYNRKKQVMKFSFKKGGGGDKPAKPAKRGSRSGNAGGLALGQDLSGGSPGENPANGDHDHVADDHLLRLKKEKLESSPEELEVAIRRPKSR